MTKNVTTHEAADFFGLKPTLLRDWHCARRGPPYVKHGKAKKSPVTYHLRDLEQWQDAKTHRGAS
jgi:hypothetical protein